MRYHVKHEKRNSISTSSHIKILMTTFLTTFRRVPKILQTLSEGVRVKNAVRMRAFPASGANHSRPQKPRSFWSAPRIATSGFTAVKRLGTRVNTRVIYALRSPCFPFPTTKFPRSTSATRAISVLSSIILPRQTFFSRVLLLRQQPFSSENLSPERPTTTIAIKTQVFMFRYELVNSTRKFTIVAEIVSLLKKIYKRDAPFRAVFKVKTLAVLFSPYPREMKHTTKFKSAAIFALTCFYRNGAIHSHARSIARAWLKHAHSFDRCGTSGPVQQHSVFEWL